MESVAARDDAARKVDRFAAVQKAHPRRIRLDIVHADVVHLEQGPPAGREPEPDEILHQLLLPVDHDRAPAGQLGKVDAVPAPVEAQLDAAMDEPFAAHALSRAALLEDVHRALLQHARAHAVLDVVPAPCLDDDRLDALEVQEMGEQQPGGSGADDGDLGVDPHCSQKFLPSPWERWHRR